MLDTLITLLQVASKRIGGKALPPEMCRHILLRCGGMLTPTAIAWKGMERHNRSQLDRIRDKWRKFNAAVAQKRKENCPHYYSTRVFLQGVRPRDVGDHRFWVPYWAWHECLNESNQKMLFED